MYKISMAFQGVGMISGILKTLVILTTSSLIGFSAVAAEGGGHHEIGFPQPVPEKAKAKRPAQPELLEPKALSKISGSSATLKWAPVENASVYVVQVATDPNFKWLITNNSAVSETSLQLSGLEAGKMYFWRVAASIPSNTASYTQGVFKASSFETTK